MSQDFFTDFNDTVNFENRIRFNFKVDQDIVTVVLFFDGICQVAFAPEIDFFNLCTVFCEKIADKLYDRSNFSFLERFCYKHDFVLFNEITYSSGHMDLFRKKGQERCLTKSSFYILSHSEGEHKKRGVEREKVTVYCCTAKF